MSWADAARALSRCSQRARLSELRLGRAAGPRDARRPWRPCAPGRPRTGGAGAPYFEEMLARRERVRAQVGRAGRRACRPDRADGSTTQGVQIVVVGLGLGPGDEVVTTDVEHFGLTGPLLGARADLRIAQVRGTARGRVLRPASRARHAAHPADRAVGGLVARRQGLPLARASRGDGGAGAGRRRPVRRRDRGRRGRGGLLHDQRPEVAVRPGCVRRRCTSASRRRCSTGSSSYPSAASYDIAAGTWEPKPGAARLRSGLCPGVVARRARGGADRPAGRALRARGRARRPLRRPAARGGADGGERARPEHARLVPRARKPDRDRGQAATSRACSSASCRTPTTSARRWAGGTTRDDLRAARRRAVRAKVGTGQPSVRARQPGDRLQRRDHVRDVLVELDAELLRALVDVVARDARRERRLLQLLPHRLRLEPLQPRRADAGRRRGRTRSARRRRRAPA